MTRDLPAAWNAKPTPAPQPTVTVLQPAPTVTVTGTVNVLQDPDPVPLADHLQGWGTIVAVLVALGVAVWGWKRESRHRTADQTGAAAEREADRADAEQRLREEREAGDQRLQQQLDAQRDHNLQAHLVRQLQEVGDMYALTLAESHAPQARTARLRLHIRLRAIPGRHASLLKRWVGIPMDNDAAFESARRMQAQNVHEINEVDPELIFDELADNVGEVLGLAQGSAGSQPTVWTPAPE